MKNLFKLLVTLLTAMSFGLMIFAMIIPNPKVIVIALFAITTILMIYIMGLVLNVPNHNKLK